MQIGFLTHALNIEPMRNVMDMRRESVYIYDIMCVSVSVCVCL